MRRVTKEHPDCVHSCNGLVRYWLLLSVSLVPFRSTRHPFARILSFGKVLMQNFSHNSRLAPVTCLLLREFHSRDMNAESWISRFFLRLRCINTYYVWNSCRILISLFTSCSFVRSTFRINAYRECVFALSGALSMWLRNTIPFCSLTLFARESESWISKQIRILYSILKQISKQITLLWSCQWRRLVKSIQLFPAYLFYLLH